MRGQPLPQARATLQASDLGEGSLTTRPTGQRPETVLEQSPGPYSRAWRESAVNLVVEASRITAPDLRARSREDAESVLASALLEVGVVTDRPTGAPPGSVLEQDPAPGTAVLQGSKVNLVLEAARVGIPDVRTRPTDEARQVLSAAGLQVGSITEQPTGAAAGSVVQMDPVPGTRSCATVVCGWSSKRRAPLYRTCVCGYRMRPRGR